MINAEAYDNLLWKELDSSDWYDYTGAVKQTEYDFKANHNTRDKLFFDFRYQQGSYKAIKAGITKPSVMMRFGKDKFRLYGDAETNKLFDKAKGILAGWKARNKADLRAYKLWLKTHKNEYIGFNDWLKLRGGVIA